MHTDSEVAMLSADSGLSLGPAYAPPDAIFLPGAPAALPPIEKPKPAPQPAPASHGEAAPVPIGGDLQAAKLIKQVIPRYPEPARRFRISGTVHLVGVIGKDGTIQNLQVVNGNPLLVQAALEAVRQWLYRPTILDGHPVEVIAPIDVIFTLGQ